MQIQHYRFASLGYASVALAAALWAASGSAAKFLFRSGISPLQLVQLRTTISAVLLFIWLLAGKRSLLKIGKKDLAYFFLLGIALAATQFTYLYTISRLSVAAAILLQYQAPVLIAGYAIFFARRRLSSATLAAVLGTVAGCYLVVGAYDLDLLHLNGVGILSGLGSAFAFALYSVKSEYGMRSYAPRTVVFYALLFAAVTWNVLVRPFSAFSLHYSAISWWWIAFISTFGTIFPFVLYNAGINLIRATRASITATLEPVIAGTLSFIFLGELMEPLQVIGAILVISSVLTLQIRRDPD
jgi:drug/metabolite transporter (DMT)-like permease